MATLTDEDLNRIEADVSLVVAAKVERLRAEVERLRGGIKAHERAARKDYADTPTSRLAGYDETLWSLLDGAT